MAIAFVNGNYVKTDGDATNVNIPAINCTAGNFLVVFVKYESTEATSISVSDTALNTWHSLPHVSYGSGGGHHNAFYAYNINGNASNVINVNFGATRQWSRAIAHQYSGIGTASDPLDAYNITGTGTGTTLTSGNISTSQADELLVCFGAGWDFITSFTPGANYTERFDLTSETNFPDVATEDRIVSSVGTYNATMTMSPSAEWQTYFVAFKAPGGSPPPVFTYNQAVFF